MVPRGSHAVLREGAPEVHESAWVRPPKGFGDGGGGVHNELLVLSRDQGQVDCLAKRSFPAQPHAALAGRPRVHCRSIWNGALQRGAGTRASKSDCRQVTGIDLDLAARLLDAAAVRTDGAGCGAAADRRVGPAADGVAHRSQQHRGLPVCCAKTLRSRGAAFDGVDGSVRRRGVSLRDPQSAGAIGARADGGDARGDLPGGRGSNPAVVCGVVRPRRGVLVVFNHPLWNFYAIPADRFRYELTRFLESANRYVHAFELNGMRNHAENRAALRLAAEWNQLVISGGDRHGCEPNASINLTNAADFAEFVEEVREGRQSTVRGDAAVCGAPCVAFLSELHARDRGLSGASGRAAAVGRADVPSGPRWSGGADGASMEERRGAGLSADACLVRR